MYPYHVSDIFPLSSHFPQGHLVQHRRGSHREGFACRARWFFFLVWEEQFPQRHSGEITIFRHILSIYGPCSSIFYRITGGKSTRHWIIKTSNTSCFAHGESPAITNSRNCCTNEDGPWKYIEPPVDLAVKSSLYKMMVFPCCLNVHFPNGHAY